MQATNFKTKAEVINALRQDASLEELNNGNFTPKGVYELKHGESDKYELKAIRYKDGWGIKKIHFYQPNTLNAPKDGQCTLYGNEYVLLSKLG